MPRAKKKAVNRRRTSKAKRNARKRKGTTGYQDRHKLELDGSAQPIAPPITIPVTWLKLVIGFFLLPFCIITTRAFAEFFTAASEQTNLLRSEPFWFFSIGAVMLLVFFFGFKKPTYLYVLGHESTHAVFVILCGGRVTDFNVSSDGGYIVTNKTNFLISLSPYFVPFWTCICVFLLWVVDFAVGGMGWYSRILFGTIGFTWAFHFVFTVWMLTKNQPDLKENGVFFSLVVIYLINLLFVSVLLILFSPEFGWETFGNAWMDRASDFMHSLGGFIERLFVG